MKKKLFLTTMAFLLSIPLGQLFAQQKESRTLLLDADYAAFRLPGDSTNSYVEFHYLLRRSQLKYEPADSGYKATINIGLYIKDSNGNLYDSLAWKAISRIEKLSDLNDEGYHIPDMVKYQIPFGKYHVDLFAYNGEKSGHAAFDLEVPSFNNKGLALSSIELAYQIKPDSVGKFVKYGWLVMPNPSGQFLQENNTINIYAEGYGFDTSSVADTSFHVALDILSSKGEFIRAITPITYQKPGESAVIIADFPIDTLKSGDYNLKMTLTDGQNSTSATRPFTISLRRESARRAILQGVLRDFPEANTIASEDDAKKFRDDITYIATGDELKLYDSLNLTGKEAFRKDFWVRRSPDPSSVQNDFEIEHYRRIKYANDAFGQFQGGHAGWKTDRGRVYILYGEPSEIERFPQSIEARAWERWNYNNLEGGVYFIFVDLENASDYTLIHSSKQNEPKDENWEDKIKVGFNAR